jgi:hypothetical protein
MQLHFLTPHRHMQCPKNMTDNTERPPSRATMSAFDALHAELIKSMADELQRCREACEAPSPAFLSQVRQTLKDNGVDVPSNDRRFDRLKRELPDMDKLEQAGNVVPIRREGAP